MDQLYGRYHGRILVLAKRFTEDGVWKAKLWEILAEFETIAASFLRPTIGYFVTSSPARSSTTCCAFPIRRKGQFWPSLSSILTMAEG